MLLEFVSGTNSPLELFAWARSNGSICSRPVMRVKERGARMYRRTVRKPNRAHDDSKKQDWVFYGAMAAGIASMGLLIAAAFITVL